MLELAATTASSAELVDGSSFSNSFFLELICSCCSRVNVRSCWIAFFFNIGQYQDLKGPLKIKKKIKGNLQEMMYQKDLLFSDLFKFRIFSSSGKLLFS